MPLFACLSSSSNPQVPSLEVEVYEQMALSSVASPLCQHSCPLGLEEKKKDLHERNYSISSGEISC